MTYLNPLIDTNISKSFTSNFNDIFNTASGIVQFGLIVASEFTGDTSASYTDYAYLNVTYEIPTPSVQPPSLDVGDPLYCSIPPIVLDTNVNILCMPKSNQTGQPLTGLTIKCQANDINVFTGGVQASSSMTELANGMYNWTLLASSISPNTCYTVNCTAVVSTVNNNFGGSVCVMPDYASATNMSSLMTSSSSNFLNTTAMNNSLAGLITASASNFANVTALITMTQNGFYNITLFNQTTNDSLTSLLIMQQSANTNLTSLANISVLDIWDSEIERTTNCSNCTSGTAEVDYPTLQGYTRNATVRDLTYYEMPEVCNNTYENYYYNSTNETFNFSYYYELKLDRAQIRDISKGVVKYQIEILATQSFSERVRGY